jgi:hypothetical protein
MVLLSPEQYIVLIALIICFYLLSLYLTLSNRTDTPFAKFLWTVLVLVLPILGGLIVIFKAILDRRNASNGSTAKTSLG